MINVKTAFQILKNLERYREAINKNIDLFEKRKNFKNSLCIIDKQAYDTEYSDYLYNKAKAELYNLDWDYSVYNPEGLIAAIELYEWERSKDKYNKDRENYMRLKAR